MGNKQDNKKNEEQNNKKEEQNNKKEERNKPFFMHIQFIGKNLKEFYDQLSSYKKIKSH